MHEKKYFERQLGNMAKRLRQISQKQDIFIPLLWHPVSSCIYVFSGLQAVIKEYIFTSFNLCHQKIYTD